MDYPGRRIAFMAQETPPVENEETQALNRRELLKVLTAAGGAIGAAAFLPARWSKPLVEAGVLPAHAQGTMIPELTISNLSVFSLDGVDPPNQPYGAYFHFNDTLCQVNDSAKLYVSASPCGRTIYNGQTLGSVGGINGTGGCDGVASFSFDALNCINSTLSVQLGVGSRISNTLKGLIPPDF
jgi:hypothetical protein